MALTKRTSLDSIGLVMESDVYINISNIVIQRRNDTFVLTVTFNIFTSRQARIDGKNIIGFDSLSVEYPSGYPGNAHSFAYAMAKESGLFGEVTDA